MLIDTKHDLTFFARQLSKPYEQYSIDELANAYCTAVDCKDDVNKNIYISALILRFWYTIDKMYQSNTVAPSLEREDFFWWLYEAIEYACKYRGWQNPEKRLNAQQCINRCIETIKLQKYYDLRLDKRKAVNFSCSIDAPISDEDGKSIGDLFEVADDFTDHSTDAAESLVQSYINENKLIEAILIDNIAFNDAQRYFKQTIKDKDSEGNDIRYIEYSSQFWPYRLVQLVSKLPDDYRSYFIHKYEISADKLDATLDAIDRANNQKLYKYLNRTLDELKSFYVA